MESQLSQYYLVFEAISNLKVAICGACDDGITRAVAREKLDEIERAMKFQFEKLIGMR